MATQGEWEEQLIAEWLSLQGYLLETNVGLIAPKAGGRNEADIVAIKIGDNRVLVKHIEVGTLNAGFSDNLKRVRKKFRNELKDSVKRFVMERIRPPSDYEWDYQCQYIFTFASRKDDLKKELEKHGIQLTPFDDIISQDIPNAIDEWRNRQIATGTVRGKDPNYIVLPRKYRLLTVFERARKLYTKGSITHSEQD
jgi:hypothetical protein